MTGDWFIYAIAAAISYSVYGLAMKQAGNFTDAFTFGALINLMASFFIFAIHACWAKFSQNEIKINISNIFSLKLISLVLLAGLALACIDIFSFIMLTKSPNTGTAFTFMYIVALSIITIGGVLFFKDNLNIQNIAGVLLAFAAIFLLSK